jgi:hypothetical protein
LIQLAGFNQDDVVERRKNEQVANSFIFFTKGLPCLNTAQSPKLD